MCVAFILAMEVISVSGFLAESQINRQELNLNLNYLLAMTEACVLSVCFLDFGFQLHLVGSAPSDFILRNLRNDSYMI